MENRGDKRWANRRLSDEILTATARLLDEQYARPLPIDQIARASGLGATGFYDQFKRRYAMTPLQYLTRRRMEQAVQLMADPHTLIANVAQSVGYDDTYYFSRAFKRYFGVAPAVFRRRVHRHILARGRSLFGNLLTLGVRSPHAQLIDTDPSSPFDPTRRRAVNHKMVIETAPELILALASERVGDLVQIAPVHAVQEVERDWRDQLRSVAGVLDLSATASAWLKRYENRVAIARTSTQDELSSAVHRITTAASRTPVPWVPFRAIKNSSLSDLRDICRKKGTKPHTHKLIRLKTIEWRHR